MLWSFGNALQGLVRGFTKGRHSQFYTQWWGLHSVLLPQCPGTSLVFTLTRSECPRQFLTSCLTKNIVIKDSISHIVSPISLIKAKSIDT